MLLLFSITGGSAESFCVKQQLFTPPRHWELGCINEGGRGKRVRGLNSRLGCAAPLSLPGMTLGMVDDISCR